MRELLEGALALARRGFSVFPCKPGEKAQLWERGHRDATRDLDAVRVLWTAHPRANVGIATGRSGVVVLDVDCKGGKPGLEWLDWERRRLPPTLEVASPSGGRHLYYRVPSGVDIVTRGSKWVHGVDVRGTRGFVVAPPSVLEWGGRYEFADDRAIADVPGWVLEEIAEP